MSLALGAVPRAPSKRDFFVDQREDGGLDFTVVTSGKFYCQTSLGPQAVVITAPKAQAVGNTDSDGELGFVPSTKLK